MADLCDMMIGTVPPQEFDLEVHDARLARMANSIIGAGVDAVNGIRLSGQ